MRDPAVASRIGLLYAAHTAGAIVGALTAGFYLVSHIGIERSCMNAGLTNVTIGVVAIVLALARRSATSAPSVAASAAAQGHEPVVIDDRTTPAAERAVLWTFVMSGVLSLAISLPSPRWRSVRA